MSPILYRKEITLQGQEWKKNIITSILKNK